MVFNGNKRIVVKLGDITEEQVDAIVNPANSKLRHGGGVARAIVLKGGEHIQLQSNAIIKEIGFLPTGKAVITDAGNLPCKYVIHVVGPCMGEGEEGKKLRNAVWSVLTLAEANGVKTISMPAISSGIFAFPKDQCAKILLKTTAEFFRNPSISIDTVYMCNHDQETYQIFSNKHLAEFYEP